MENKDGTYMDELTEALGRDAFSENTGEEIFAGEIDVDDFTANEAELDRILTGAEQAGDVSESKGSAAEIKEDVSEDAEGEHGELFGSEIGAEDLFSHPKTEESPETSEVKIEGVPTDTVSEEEKESGTEDEAEVPKQSKIFSLFHKLFANVPPTEEELDAMPSTEEKIEKARLKFEAATKKKEEKKEKALAKKKQKAEEAKKKANEAKLRKKAKEEEKKLSKKDRELRRLQAEAALPPEGRINRAGAAIVFLFFLIFTFSIIVGSGAFSYNVKIANVSHKFEHQKYTEAFEGIRGVEVKDKDKLIKEKVYTVMYVLKQLNSYENFHAMEDHASALDSLIKGLERYDKYIKYATQIGIKRDLNGVRKRILEKLQKSYGMNERAALVMMGYSDKREYSEKVYELAAKADQKMAKGRESRDRKYVP